MICDLCTANPFETEMKPTRNVHKAVILTLIATLGIVLMNTCAKMSSIKHDPMEMVFFRGVLVLSVLIPYMLITRSSSIFKTKRIKAHLYRAIVGNLGIGFGFWAYTLLPMADATALLYAAPLFVTSLSPLLLKERVDGFQWTAVVIGFCGILLIAKPSVNMLANAASLIALAAALFGALVDMALRNLGSTEDPLTTVFYFILVGVIITGPYTLLFGTMPDVTIIPWIIGIGMFAILQQLSKTTAFRLAEASLLAPYTYSSIVWATLLGWLLWKDFPGTLVLLGTAVVIGSNLLIWWLKSKPHGK